MSTLRILPEFVSGVSLARSGKWASAKSEFVRCGDVMRHANNTRDTAIASLYTGTCLYYSGELSEATSIFKSLNTSIQGNESNPVKVLAGRYALSTMLPTASKSETQSLLYRTKSSTDTWSHLAADLEPAMGSFSREVWEFIHSGGLQSMREPTTSTELIGFTHGLVSVADQRLGQLPNANIDGSDVSDAVDLVTRSLRSAENIGKSDSADLQSISKFFIAQSLILRGRLFEFNANALMAEGMYRAAMDVSGSKLTPRLSLVNRWSAFRLGNLLSKWEKREREGKLLHDASNIQDSDEILLRRFILEPTIDELERIV